jgi:hypothetical protein
MKEIMSHLKDLQLTLKMIKLESQKQRIDGNLIRNLANKAEYSSAYLKDDKKC